MRPKLKHVLLVRKKRGAGIQKRKLLKKISITAVCFLLQMTAFSQRDASQQKAKTVTGVASFYSKHLEGSKTATGEVFHHNQLVAASNSFKLNSLVRITNMRNGLSIIVRINDRMSKTMHSLGRVADVTMSAAKQLGFINKGLTRVKVELVPQGTIE